MKNNLKANVIFDNGGGITLQLGGEYAHYYDNPEQAATDYKTYLEDGTTEGWEGHEEENLEFEASYEEIQNGGLLEYNMKDVENAINNSEFETGWTNVREFIDALKA